MRLGPSVRVPSNASRYLRSQEEARRQPVSRVELAWNESDPYLYNASFDPSSIAHDEAYCTSVVDLDGLVQVPTAAYFAERVLPHACPSPSVVDVGCGQGELVHLLRAQGIDASGYDPVLREPTDHLHDRYWTPEEEAADIFVMRCVLPHIPDPWTFLRAIGDLAADALVLIEFQRLEWIVEESIWYQISHDHVNLFSTDDFEARFTVVDHGTFSHGEWAWVLIRAGSYVTPRPRVTPPRGVVDLFATRTATLGVAASLGRPIAVWGAAGKGIVLTHALIEAGADVVAAIDADPLRQGMFMEVSGVEILAPEEAVDRLAPQTLVAVSNPNHLEAIRDRYRTWELALPADLAGQPLAHSRI